MQSLDALIEEAVIVSELAAGTPGQWLTTRGDARMVAVLGGSVDAPTGKMADWTEEEERFVIDNMRWMSDEEIGRQIGRTADAVKIHRFRQLHCPPRRNDPEWPTLQQVMRIMGLTCQKQVAMWVNHGLISARYLPTGTEEIRAISLLALYRWAVNPENWIYFKPERVTDPHLRRLIALRRQRWDDAWWTPGQVGAYHGVTHMAVNNRINAGTLPAKRWGNWWIKRSDAMALKIFPRKGRTQSVLWTDAADAFLVVTRALGYSYTAIGALCGWDDGRVVFRLNTLKKEDLVEPLIQENNLALRYKPTTGTLFADWRDFPARFPRLERAISRFLEGNAKRADLSYVAYTLRTWWQWHAETEAERDVAEKIAHASSLTPATLHRYYGGLQRRGVEPLVSRP